MEQQNMEAERLKDSPGGKGPSNLKDGELKANQL